MHLYRHSKDCDIKSQPEYLGRLIESFSVLAFLSIVMTKPSIYCKIIIHNLLIYSFVLEMLFLFFCILFSK